MYEIINKKGINKTKIFSGQVNEKKIYLFLYEVYQILKAYFSFYLY